MNKALELLQMHIGQKLPHSPSPLMRWLDPRILSVEEGSLMFEYEIRNEWLNPAGNLHGGIIAAIIDDTIGATLFAMDDPFIYATINNAIDYFGGSKEGQKIIAKTAVVKKGKQLINAQCEIWDNEQTRLLAKGYSNLYKTEYKK
ncbi:MAG: PaaI family thioesterase [Cyclobacteriaceae bacterium]|nr:PaaI family thioesterase [Cyclobacteriaceae bacterium]